MSSVETRNVARDSLFLFAQLTFEGRAAAERVKVRNLSAGGMMAETGGAEVSQGDRLTIELRNVGAVKGSVAWTQDDRFGVAFDTESDPKIVRAPVGTKTEPPAYLRKTALASPTPADATRIRKL